MVKVAIVGAGPMALAHAQAFADVPGVTLAGVYSRTRAKAQKLADELKIEVVADSLEDLYRQTQADLVVVAVSVSAMHDLAVASCAFPWTPLLEKPAGLDLAECESIARHAEQTGRSVLVGHNRRFLHSAQTLREQADAVDGPRFIVAQDQQSLATAHKVGHPAEVVDRWMFANSIHLIDLMCFLGRGEITHVTPLVPWRGGETNVVVAKVGFSSGDVALYEGIWNGPGPWAVSVATPAARWEMRPLERLTRTGPDRKAHEIEPSGWDTTFKPGLRAQAESAVAAVRGEPSDITRLADALRSMKLVDQIFFGQSTAGERAA